MLLQGLKMRLITHDGAFHADDVFSTVILKDLFPEAEIIRTRDMELISPGPDKIVYDVGQQYDPEQNIYDHHQNGSPVREDGVPYSSFGLIWKEYGEQWLSQCFPDIGNDLAAVHISMDRGFVRDVDALDNGVTVPGGSSPLNITMIIAQFMPDFDDDNYDGIMQTFTEAVSFTNVILHNRARGVAAKLRAQRIVSQAIEDQRGSPVLELPCGMPWDQTLRRAEATDVRFVLIPRQDGWTISAVRDKPSEFVNRLDLPAEWGGLTGDALVEVSGVKGAKFCHKALFFAATETREGALEMIEKALLREPKIVEDPSP